MKERFIHDFYHAFIRTGGRENTKKKFHLTPSNTALLHHRNENTHVKFILHENRPKCTYSYSATASALVL